MKLPILFKRSTTGKISQWQIEIEGNKFRTISGFTDGLNFTSAWTVCDGKSYNSSDEQALKQAKAIQKKKIELGAFENIKDIDKPILFKPMLAKDWKDEKDKVKYPIGSQRKLDGVRNITQLDINGMSSRNGKKIVSAPHIFKALQPLFELYPDLILDGELYAPKESCDFNKIISCVRKTKPTPEDLIESEKYIQYWIYDCPSLVGSFIERMEFLKSLKLPKCCVLVSTEIANNEKEVMTLYKQYIEEGYEGQILRVLGGEYENKRSKYLLKHKSFLDKEYEIKGVLEGKGKLTGKVGKLVFDGFDSAVNGDHEYLEQLYRNRNLIGKIATVKFFEFTTDGIPRFPKVIAIRDYEN